MYTYAKYVCDEFLLNFYRILRLWNSIPIINLSYPLTAIKSIISESFY